MYDFQEKDLDYNWIPVYYSFVEPCDCEPQLKATDLKFVSIDTKSVNTDDDESGSKDGVLRKYKKTRRGHAAGKKKRTHMLRRRERNIQEHGNIAVILDTLNASRQIEEPEAEGSDFFKWNRRGRGF
ncbi:hypothetical protein ACJMK2_017289 [Sinanodonta woodiana]|uniref:Uncharacterized protein n=1 Tax=Sinanodonta woodiana TaxID=1069815 RepID=A0ABD3UWE6_SINWO